MSVVMCGELGVGRKLNRSLRLDCAALRTAKAQSPFGTIRCRPPSFKRAVWPSRPRQRPSARICRLRRGKESKFALVKTPTLHRLICALYTQWWITHLAPFLFRDSFGRPTVRVSVRENRVGRMLSSCLKLRVERHPSRDNTKKPNSVNMPSTRIASTEQAFN